MKKHFYLMIAAVVAAMSFAFTSCSEQDTPVPAGQHGAIQINGQEYTTRLFDNTNAGYTAVGEGYKLYFQTMFMNSVGQMEALNIYAAPYVVIDQDEDGQDYIKGYVNPQIGDELSDVQLDCTRANGFFGYKGTVTATSGKVTVTDVTRQEDTTEGTITLTFDNVKFNVSGTDFVINGSIQYAFDFLK